MATAVARCEVVTWFNINVPAIFLQRDCVIRAYACDCIWESGCVMMLGNSVEQENLKGVDVVLPVRPTPSLTRDRMDVKGTCGVMTADLTPC